LEQAGVFLLLTFKTKRATWQLTGIKVKEERREKSPSLLSPLKPIGHS